MAGVLIVANGAWPKSFKVEEVFAEYERVLALDGAANRMVDAGIVPTAIIGDLDSVANTTLEALQSQGNTCHSHSESGTERRCQRSALGREDISK